MSKIKRFRKKKLQFWNLVTIFGSPWKMKSNKYTSMPGIGSVIGEITVEISTILRKHLKPNGYVKC